MKTQQLTRILFSATIAIATFAFSAAFAQVKIGTNPTIIGANSNLEVEAANNKKVIVHKNDGTMVIENTPPGAITDSMLSVDAAGNVRSISAARITRPPVYSFEMTIPGGTSDASNGPQGSSFPLTFPNNGFITPGSATADRLNSGTWKAPATGIYRVDLMATAMANNNVSGYGIVTIKMLQNGGPIRTAAVTVTTYGPNANRGTATVTLTKVVSLAAGETISANADTCLGCGPDYYWVIDRYLNIQRLE